MSKNNVLYIRFRMLQPLQARLSFGQTHCPPAAPASQVCVAQALQLQRGSSRLSLAGAVGMDAAGMLVSTMSSEAPVHPTSRVASHVESLQQADGLFSEQTARAAERGRNIIA
jgi:hypothetical protein